MASMLLIISYYDNSSYIIIPILLYTNLITITFYIIVLLLIVISYYYYYHYSHYRASMASMTLPLLYPECPTGHTMVQWNLDYAKHIVHYCLLLFIVYYLFVYYCLLLLYYQLLGPLNRSGSVVHEPVCWWRVIFRGRQSAG